MLHKLCYIINQENHRQAGLSELELKNGLINQLKSKEEKLCSKLTLFKQIHCSRDWSSPDELIGWFIEEMKNLNCAVFNYHNHSFDHFCFASKK